MDKKTSVSEIVIAVCFWIYLAMIIDAYAVLKSWEMEKRARWTLATGRNYQWTNADRWGTIGMSLVWPFSLPVEYSTRPNNAFKQYMKEESSW